MKNLFLLLLFCCSFFSALGQNTTSGVFQNSAYVQPEPSYFGTTDITYFECESDIILDGSSSMGEDSYKIILAEFDLTTWTNVNVFYDQWICTSCNVPNNIDVLSFFPNGKPECDKTYILTLATGPVYDAKFFFFSVDCGSDPLLKTFSAKINSVEFDSTALPLTNDLCHSAYEDPVTKEIRLAGYTNGIGSGNFDPYIANFDNTGTKQLFDRSINDTQDDYIYYNNPAILECTNQGTPSYAMMMTGRRDDDFLISIDDPLTGLNIYHNVFGENSGATEVGHSIIQDPNGGIVAVGFVNNGTADDVYVVALDSCLDVRFTKSYTLTGNARANSVAVVDGLLNISGSPLGGFQYAITGKVDNDVFVMIIDPFTGDPVGPSSMRYDIHNNADDTGESIIMDKNGDIVVTGTTDGIEPGNPQPIFPSRRPFILKIGKGDEFNSNWGNIDAITRIEIQNSQDESSHSIATTAGGDYVITGFSKADYSLLNQGIRPASTHITKVSEDLSSVIFSNSYSEGARSTIGERISVTSTDRLVLAGYCTEQYELNSGALAFDSDIYLIATDSLGQLDNCICYNEESAVILAAIPTAIAQAVLQVDLTQPEFPVQSPYAAFDLPVSYCDKYCPEPSVGSTCSVSGCPASSVLNISTGIDGGGNLLPINNATTGIDPFWRLINLPALRDPIPAGVNFPEMYAVDIYPLAAPNWNNIGASPISQPISVRPNSAFNADNLNVSQPWRIRREFCVCDTAEVDIAGLMRADDVGFFRLYEEGNPSPLVNVLGATNPGTNITNFFTDWSINWTGTLNPGTYHLEFEMVNTLGSAMGFNVSAQITDLGNNNTLLNSTPNCCGKGTLAIQKLIDEDCSDSRTPADQEGSGWNFQITNTATNVTVNATTDIYGEIILRQLPFGTYTITESWAAPWVPSNPTSGTQTITIDAANPNGMVDFLNKNPELCTCIEEEINPIFPNPTPTDACCCYEFVIDNNYGPYYDEIEIVANGFNINVLNNTSGFANPVPPNAIKASYTIPPGTNQSIVEFCTNDLVGTSTVTVNWYYQGNIVCTSDLDVTCDLVEPTIKTFDVTHQLEEDTLNNSFDFGVAAIQNVDGDFISIGHALSVATNEIDFAFADYDFVGQIINTPQLNVPNDPNIGFLEVIDAKEIINASGAQDGYIVLLYEDSNPNLRTYLARLNTLGQVVWIDLVDATDQNGILLDLIPRDFIIDGNQAVITGKLIDGQIDKPFALSYDFVTHSVSCINYYLLAATAGLPSEGTAISKMSNGNYGIAGRYGNDGIYFEINTSCNIPSTFQPIRMDASSIVSDMEIPVKILEDNIGNPVICGNIERGSSNDLVYVFYGNVTTQYELNNSEAKLYDAMFDLTGDIVLAGEVDINQSNHGFLAVADFQNAVQGSIINLNWSRRYFDVEYPETGIRQITLAHDGGYYTVGYGVDKDAPTIGFNLNFFDTWIMKTDMGGNLQDCDCYEDIPFQVNGNDGVFNISNDPVAINGSATMIPPSFSPLQDAETVCDRFCPTDTCLISSTIFPIQQGDTCCYALDLNNQSTTAYQVEVIINTPSVFFDFATISTALNFSYSPQSIILDNGGSPLPSGSTLNYLQFCLGNSSSATVTLQNFTLKYYDIFGNELPECEQTFEEECILECTDEECVDIFNISVECDSLVAGKFKFTYQVMNKTTDAVLTDLNWNVLTPGTILGATSTPIVTPIGPGVTSVDQCIDIFDAGPSFPKQVDIVFAASGYIVGHPDSLMCCHDQKDTVTIILPNCCDPCDTTWVVEESIQVIGGECCYNLDINNTCDDLLSKIKVSSITSGVNLGSHWNPNYSSTWNFAPSGSAEVIWQPSTAPFASAGNYVDLIYFCLDNTIGATNPQVKVEYITTNSNGVDSVICEEILDLECETDIECIDITQDSVYCDDAGNYFLDFCVQNISTPAFNAGELLVSKLSSTPPFLNLNQYTWNGPPFPLTSGAPPVCFTVQINGFGTNLPMAGDMMDLAFSLKNIAGDSCCYESDTISIILPPCPVDTSSIVGCCDSLLIYGDVDDNRPTRIKVYNGNTYITSSRTQSGDTYGLFSKFDGNGNLVWEVELDIESQFLDFVETDNNEFLLVGRTMPVGPPWANNQSILAKVDDNGVLQFSRIYQNYGREFFLKIVKHPSPQNLSFPYYVVGIENQDGTANSAFDEFHLYNIDDNGTINFGKEYTFNYATGTSTDDQWTGIIPLNNGNLLIQGDYFPEWKGVLIELNGLNGSVVNTPFESDIDMRYFDAEELPSGKIVVVGAYSLTNNTIFNGAVILLNSDLTYAHSIEYSNQGIGGIRQLEQDVNGDLFAVGQGQNGIPIILKYEVDAVANTITEVESKYFLDGETDFSSPNIFTNSSVSRLFYADARKNNPKMYGDFDIIFGSFDLNLTDSCLVDTVLTSVEIPFEHIGVAVTEIDYDLPQPTEAFLANPNYMWEYLCPDSSMVDTCCTDVNDFELRAQQTMISKISCSPTVGEVANSLLNNCNEVNIDWGDGLFDLAVPSSSLPIQHTYASAGIYVVEVLINEFDTNGNLCFEFLISDTIDCTVSTNDLIWENQISFFPNPFTQDFQIKIENSNHDGFDLEVLSVDGKLILKDQVARSETSKTLEMKNKDAGVYFIRMTDSDGNRAIHRMVKMNF